VSHDVAYRTKLVTVAVLAVLDVAGNRRNDRAARAENLLGGSGL
jgi:hypothetical protein